MWRLWHGSWWMIQLWTLPCISLGIHIEPRWWLRNANAQPYGPYIDFHLFFVIVSIGRNPVWSTAEQAYLAGRGGWAAD